MSHLAHDHQVGAQGEGEAGQQRSDETRDEGLQEEGHEDIRVRSTYQLHDAQFATSGEGSHPNGVANLQGRSDQQERRHSEGHPFEGIHPQKYRVQHVVQVNDRLHTGQALRLRHHPLILLGIDQFDAIGVLNGVLGENVLDR